LFKNKTNAGQNGDSEGITGQPGDQGNPNGMANVKRYDGQGGNGNGTQYSLGGRGAKSLIKPNRDFSEQGTIVVNIWVNPEGKVIRTGIATKGTTIIDSGMRSMAREAALRSSFDADPSAPMEQKGTITYTFVINN
jgi:TonB family C-terminal domain